MPVDGPLGPIPNFVTGQKLSVTQLLGKTNPAQSIGSFTTPNDGIAHLYLFVFSVIISAWTSGSVTPQISFTDENGTVRNITNVAGGSVGFFGQNALCFLAQPNTAVTFTSTGTLVGTFDIYGAVLQLA